MHINNVFEPEKVIKENIKPNQALRMYIVHELL